MTRRRPPRPAMPRQLGISEPTALPTHWSPEQATAVFEILDELRERVWGQYSLQIQQVLREDRRAATPLIPNDIDQSDVPF